MTASDPSDLPDSAGSHSNARTDAGERPADGTGTDEPPRVTLYWRPGCGYCSSLRTAVDHLGIQLEEVNIWNDAADARIVQKFAGGNETVPTVVIGDPEGDPLTESVGLVNPSIGVLVDALRQLVPEALPPEMQDSGR